LIRLRGVLLVVLAAVTCARREPGFDPAKLPPELAVAAGAAKVEPVGDGASFAVQYRLPAPYPAEEFLRDLQTRLTASGWKAMERDFLNPEIPTSNVRGWTAFVDPATRPPVGVHRWQGAWTNEKGDVVNYNLEYAVPANAVDQPPPPEAQLKVTAFLNPAERAREMAAAAARAKKH
jgi:hypothetical protein